MRRNPFSFRPLVACVLGLSLVSSQAILTEAFPGLLLDDQGTDATTDDQYWISDLGSFVGQTYDEQIATIAGIDLLGLDWRMATYSDVLGLSGRYDWTELAAVFTPTRPELPSYKGRYDRVFGTPTRPFPAHYEMIMNDNDGDGEFSGGSVGVADHETFPGAWVTANVRVSVPDAGSTLALLGIAGVGIAGLRRRMKA